jgi:hypothetical protein
MIHRAHQGHTGTLQHEIFFSAHELEAILFEGYRDNAAALEHFAAAE